MKSHIADAYAGTYYTPVFKEIKRPVTEAPQFYGCRQCQCKIVGTPHFQYFSGRTWEMICSVCARVAGELYGYQCIRKNPVWLKEHQEEAVK